MCTFYKGFELCELRELFSQVTAVQDYPNVYRNEKPRKNDETYLKAVRDDFLFGKHFGRVGHYGHILMVKPSAALTAEWASSPYCGMKINDMTINSTTNPALADKYIVKVHYMEGIGSQVVGTVNKDEFDALCIEMLTVQGLNSVRHF